MMKFHKANTSTPYRMAHDAPISFESMIRETEKSSDGSECETIDEVCSDINSIPEGDIKKLQPVLWLELATIFDKHHIALDKRKPFKKKRKEEGNVFGVSLNALVRRDQQVTGEDTSLVPLILQSILRELVSRGAKEEGILRVAGHKQKVRWLKRLLESWKFDWSFVKKLRNFVSFLKLLMKICCILKKKLKSFKDFLRISKASKLFLKSSKASKFTWKAFQASKLLSYASWNHHF